MTNTINTSPLQRSVNGQDLKEGVAPNVTMSEETKAKMQTSIAESKAQQPSKPVELPSVTVEISTAPFKHAPKIEFESGVLRYTPEGDPEYLHRNELLAAELEAQTNRKEFNPTSYLANITELDLSKGSYKDGVRNYAGFLPYDMDGNRLTADYKGFNKAPVVASFSLDIETKDGDKVTITINKEEGGTRFAGGSFAGIKGSSFEFDFEGDLDEDELEAIQTLAMDLSQSAGAFFNGQGMAQLNGLESFDKNELSGFDLSLYSQRHMNSEAEFHFEIDKYSGNQTLEASQFGLEYSITVDKNNQLVDKDANQSLQFQSYLAMIDHMAESYKIPGLRTSEVASFFKDGFSTALGFSLGEDYEREENDKTALNDHQLKVAQSSLSGLPDFEASFFGTGVAGVTPNLEKPTERSFMSLEIQQETSVQKGLNSKGRHAEITQASTYELDVRQHKPLLGLDLVDFKNQTYRYETMKEEGALLRSINVQDDGKINSGKVTQAQSKEETMIEYQNGDVTDQKESKEQFAQSLDTTELDVLKDDKLNRQLGLYKTINTLLDN
ncbi:hypothetical protein [Litoribrevibacter albus]|uniref:Uncharacterized protein n=1 Tax=Litoribrevibacter albus TaxID=1473156 RepID=A0AA37S926_9GAMM|nr:hypothetical protein [Litoribrevibacter albus]GLQ30394.1 hypothetical protein GCM10007876_08720 [Litoribrevibacter albus]